MTGARGAVPRMDRSLQVAEARSMAFFWDKKKKFFSPYHLLSFFRTLGRPKQKEKP